jgi:hypothetical protein
MQLSISTSSPSLPVAGLQVVAGGVSVAFLRVSVIWRPIQSEQIGALHDDLEREVRCLQAVVEFGSFGDNGPFGVELRDRGELQAVVTRRRRKESETEG